MTWRAYIERVDYQAVLNLYLIDTDSGGAARQVRPVAFAPATAGSLRKPAVSMEPDEGRQFLQAIVDAAWENGIRPTGYDDFRRENDARRAHLDDLRAVVGKTLDIPGLMPKGLMPKEDG